MRFILNSAILFVVFAITTLISGIAIGSLGVDAGSVAMATTNPIWMGIIPGAVLTYFFSFTLSNTAIDPNYIQSVTD